MADEQILYHIVPAEYYDQQPGDQPYRPPRFEEEGFIHCTQGEDRLLLVANTVYRRTPGKFWLLVIDRHKVQAELRYEIVGEILFPHIHGPLNRDAIIRVQEMARGEDGVFLPLGLPVTSPDDLSVYPPALATQASIEDVLAEARRLRQLATERIAVLEQEIQAYMEGRSTPTPEPAPPPTPIKIPIKTPAKTPPEVTPARPKPPKAPVEIAPARPALAETPPVEPKPEDLAGRLARLEQHVIDLRSLLVDRMDKLETRLEALEKKRRLAAPPKPAAKKPKTGQSTPAAKKPTTSSSKPAAKKPKTGQPKPSADQ